MHRLTRTLAAAALASALVVAGGCSSSSSKGTDAGSKEPVKITYTTAFGFAGRDAFAFVAKKLGYFTDEGLDVTIKPGAATNLNMQALSSGQSQFAANDLTGALVLEGKGQYTDVRAIAAIHQRNLSSIVGVVGGTVNTPSDIQGKKIGVAIGSVVQLLYPAYAKLAGLNPNDVTWVPVAPTALSGLLKAKKVDGLATFLIGTPGIQKVTGKQTVVLPYSTYLTDLYGNGLLTTATYAKAHPDVVTRFRRAALKGLTYAIANPDEAAKILNGYSPTADPKAAAGEIKLMTPYVGTGAEFGALDAARMARGIAILQGAGLFPSGLTPDKIVDFTFASKPTS